MTTKGGEPKINRKKTRRGREITKDGRRKV